MAYVQYMLQERNRACCSHKNWRFIIFRKRCVEIKKNPARINLNADLEALVLNVDCNQTVYKQNPLKYFREHFFYIFFSYKAISRYLKINQMPSTHCHTATSTL